MKKNLSDLNIKIGRLKRGKYNSISDVDGVRVGHITYSNNEIQTGITAIVPHSGNLFKDKLIASSYVINGFGKTIGTIQINELGTLETPILLTNTLSVGRVADGLVKYMLRDNRDIGVDTSTVNPVVCECNDGYLNTIQNLFLNEEDVFNAIESASIDFEEGNVGAGTGMVCYGLKGGIGSSSRIVNINNKDCTVGVLVLTNFGRMEDFTLNGQNIGEKIKKEIESKYNREDKGSIITIVATDIPLSYRQINRVIKRAVNGIAKTGSFTGNGSGEIVIGFSTANIIKHYEEKAINEFKFIREDLLNDVFKATAEATEEAILSSLINSTTTIGRDNNIIYSINEFLDKK